MTALNSARDTFRGWLHLPDTGTLDVVLGTVAANRLAGDPVWTLLVGPPGGGKSEILNAISHLSDTHPAGTLTEASLLSGTPKKDVGEGSKGGLLRAIGHHGILVCKDFGSVLSMNRDARAGVLAALREIFDGSWTRHVGTDGGRTLSWEGKVGLIGGVTPTIDRHHAVMGAMGERFTLYRLAELDNDTQARRALGHAGREHQMREELAAAADNATSTLTIPRKRHDRETDQLVALATFVVRARSSVERDSYSREIELVPGAEAPARLVITLDRLLAGLDAIGCDRGRAMELVTKSALDSIPALRLLCLRALQQYAELDTNQVATETRHPTSTCRRALEDLVAHNLVECERQQAANQPHHWHLSDFASERLGCFPVMSGSESCFPETSEEDTEPLVPNQKPDITGKQELLSPDDLSWADIEFAAQELQRETGKYGHPLANVIERAQGEQPSPTPPESHQKTETYGSTHDSTSTNAKSSDPTSTASTDSAASQSAGTTNDASPANEISTSERTQPSTAPQSSASTAPKSTSNGNSSDDIPF